MTNDFEVPGFLKKEENECGLKKEEENNDIVSTQQDKEKKKKDSYNEFNNTVNKSTRFITELEREKIINYSRSLSQEQIDIILGSIPIEKRLNSIAKEIGYMKSQLYDIKEIINFVE